MFASDGNVKKAFIDSIVNSIKERKENACSTWDPVAVLATAWGVKEMVDLSHAEAVQEYVRSISGTEMILDDGTKTSFLKGDVKIKSDQAILIYRYQIAM